MSQFVGVPFGRQFAENFADRPVGAQPYSAPSYLSCCAPLMEGCIQTAQPCGPSLPPDGGAQMKKIIGVTKDANGAPLGTCIVQGFRTANDQYVRETISDPAGNYVFCTEFLDSQYLVAYKVGAPDVAGTTVNTLTGV